MKTQHTPGVFEIMADFRSFDIQQWLDTTTTAHARALFETGAKLEQQRAELINALQLCSDFISRAAGGEEMTEDERWALLSDAQAEARDILTRIL